MYKSTCHPYNCFPRDLMYTCIYIHVICLCHLSENALYMQLKKLHHSRGLGQLMGVMRNRTRAQYRPAGRQLLVALHGNWN